MNFENWIPIIYELKTNTHTHTHTHTKKLSPPPPLKPPSSSSTLTQPKPESTTSHVESSTLLTRRRTFGDATTSPCSSSPPSPCSSNFPLLHHQWQIVESFKVQISQRSRERLLEQELPISAYANALAGVTIINEIHPNQVHPIDHSIISNFDSILNFSQGLENASFDASNRQKWTLVSSLLVLLLKIFTKLECVWLPRKLGKQNKKIRV